jgi:hypothetical protein
MEDNIKMDHSEIEWGGLDWIDPDQDMDQCRGSHACGHELSGSIKMGF